MFVLENSNNTSLSDASLKSQATIADLTVSDDMGSESHINDVLVSPELVDYFGSARTAKYAVAIRAVSDSTVAGQYRVARLCGELKAGYKTDTDNKFKNLTNVADAVHLGRATFNMNADVALKFIIPYYGTDASPYIAEGICVSTLFEIRLIPDEILTTIYENGYIRRADLSQKSARTLANAYKGCKSDTEFTRLFISKTTSEGQSTVYSESDFWDRIFRYKFIIEESNAETMDGETSDGETTDAEPRTAVETTEDEPSPISHLSIYAVNHSAMLYRVENGSNSTFINIMTNNGYKVLASTFDANNRQWTFIRYDENGGISNIVHAKFTKIGLKALKLDYENYISDSLDRLKASLTNNDMTVDEYTTSVKNLLTYTFDDYVHATDNIETIASTLA